MTTINPGDVLKLTGGTRVLDMTTLRAAIRDKTKWQPWARGTEADITLTSPWVHGYADTYGSGQADWTKELLLYWARLEAALMPNINALNALGSTTFSVNVAGNVVSLIRKMTAARSPPRSHPTVTRWRTRNCLEAPFARNRSASHRLSISARP